MLARPAIDLPFLLPEPFSIEIGGEPKGKGRPRFSRKSGTAYTPEQTRLYEIAIRAAAGEFMGRRPPVEGPVVVRVHAYFSIPKSWTKRKQAQARVGIIKHCSAPDCDNVLKVATDPLNGIVWRDDRQVYDAQVTKAYSDRPRLLIVVEAAA